MSSSKWATVTNGVIDVISFDPDREWIVESVQVPILDENGEPTGETETVITGGHWGDVLPPWIPVPDDVYAGFIQNPDGTFSAPPVIPLPPVPYTLLMSDFWSRFADDTEYDLFDTALATALPAKDRRAFNSATSLRSDSTLFTWARNLLITVVTETRADEIMASGESNLTNEEIPVEV